MISVTAQHAIRALAALASQEPGRPVLGRDLSQLSGVPQNYLSKILIELGRAGLVSAARGAGGGYRLKQPAERIALSSVVHLFDPPQVHTGCLLGHDRECSDEDSCAAHDRWLEVLETFAAFLENTRLSDVATDWRRKMDPIETLANEHGLIRHFVDNLALAAEKIEEGARPPREVFEMGVEFARTFADSFHHLKEEHVLFVRLAQKKKGEFDAQLEVLRQQHDRCRALVNRISEAIDGYAKGDDMKAADLVEHIGAYTALLRLHIHTEDHVFFPMAREELTEDDLQGLRAEFAKESQRGGGATFEACHKLVVDMGSKLVHM